MENIAHADPALAPIGLSAFAMAMTVGRLFGDRARVKYGDRNLMVACGLIATLGLACAIIFIQPFAVIGGLFIVGIGLSAIVPIAYSVAGHTKDLPPGVGLAMVTTVGYSGFLFGPPSDLISTYDSRGNLPVLLGDVRLLFDGDAAPLFGIGPFQITAQVPYSVAVKSEVSVQLFYKQIPSNTIALKVVPAAPGIFTFPGSSQAVVLNEDGSVNSAGNPAASGSVIALFATGYGQTSPPGVTGKAAQTPYATPLIPVSVTIADVPADLLYQAEAPGFVGLLQVNARVPAIGTGRPRSVPIILKIGDQPSPNGVTISVL